MEKALETFKVITTGVVSFIVAQLGGMDSVLSLLIVLISTDVITGLLRGAFTKTLSSEEMCKGLVRKSLIFVLILVACKVDVCIVEANESPITLFGREFTIRLLFLVYFCIEEGISLLENLAELGVPFPQWLRGILVQVSDCTNKSTPKTISNWLSNAFGVKLESDDENAENGDACSDTRKTVEVEQPEDDTAG